MTQKTIRVALAIVLCLSVSLAYAQRGKEKGKPGGGGRSEPGAGGQPGRGGAGGGQPGRESGGNSAGAAARKPGGTTPGGEWSQRGYGGKPSGQQLGRNSADAGAAFEKNKSTGASGDSGKAAGAAAFKNNSSTPSGAEGAAAGKAAAGRNSGNATGAAAGAAAVNRNESTATGAQGVAAGAAAANRKSPTATGARSAAAGAAAVNRNQPTATGAQVAAAGAAVANRNSSTVSGATGAAVGYAAVRNSFNNPNLYGQQWYGAHPAAWVATGLAAGTVWTPAAPSAVANYGGYSNAASVSYSYGDNVQLQNGNVMVDGQSVGTAAEYSQQAANLAQQGTDANPAADDQWLSLGVFAMVRDENQKPQLFMQFAINKQGILRGNYTDEANGHTSPIHGAVDKQTQRAAWTVGDNQQSVMEAGINNLTQGEAPALIHKNGKTDHWILIRLDQPKTAQN